MQVTQQSKFVITAVMFVARTDASVRGSVDQLASACIARARASMCACALQALCACLCLLCACVLCVCRARVSVAFEVSCVRPPCICRVNMLSECVFAYVRDVECE